jgi:hypothetical protein
MVHEHLQKREASIGLWSRKASQQWRAAQSSRQMATIEGKKCPLFTQITILRLRSEERIPRHVQYLIFGNDRVQVAQQGEVFGFDDSALGELG